MKFELKDPFFLPHCACEVSISLNSSEALILVGENGIGKSTLLHRFCTLLDPSTWVLVEQKTLDYFFERKLSTLKSLFLQVRPPQLNKEVFHYLWNAFELHKKEDRWISQLSGGEGQALKLCLTLSKETDFYFLDEPTQYLDIGRKQFLFSYLEELRKKGKSLLLVEHDREGLPAGWRVQELKMDGRTLSRGAEWII